MTNVYQKITTIKAEQFDGSKEMAKQYGAELYSNSGYGYAVVEGEPDGDGYVLDTLKGELLVRIGDWIIKEGEDINVIDDDTFKENYEELTVIPKFVADWIEECKNNGISIANSIYSDRRPEKVREWMEYTPGKYKIDLERYHKYQELVAKSWIEGYQVEE